MAFATFCPTYFLFCVSFRELPLSACGRVHIVSLAFYDSFELVLGVEGLIRPPAHLSPRAKLPPFYGQARDLHYHPHRGSSISQQSRYVHQCLLPCGLFTLIYCLYLTVPTDSLTTGFLLPGTSSSIPNWHGNQIKHIALRAQQDLIHHTSIISIALSLFV